MIEKILPNNKTKVRILKTIYENPEINLTALIKKSKASPNLVLRYVNDLLGLNILQEKRLGGKKKAHIRTLTVNLSSNLSALVMSLIEIEKKLIFIDKYNEIRPFVNQLTDLLNGKIGFCLVYGSFARLSADKDSDVDIWLVGKPSLEMKKRISEIFSTLKREYSIKIETLSSFIKRINDSIHQNIIKEHIILYNETGFLKALAKTTKH